MASVSHLRSRRSAAQLHALEGVEREIRANDPNGRRKYLRDFSQAYRSYQSVIELNQVYKEVQDADLVGVGQPVGQLRPELDYDTTFANYIRGRPVILGYYFNSDKNAVESGALPEPVLPAETFNGRAITILDNASSARSVGNSSPNPNPACSASTIPRARVSDARASATPSTTTST